MNGPLEAPQGVLPNKPREALIDRFSFTGDILSYTRCSKQYGTFEHYGYAKALPIQAWFGDVVHMTIEMLFRQFNGEIENASDEEIPGKLPTDEDVEYHAATAIAILKSKGMNARERDHQTVMDLIKTFNSTEGVEFYGRIVRSEVRLETIVEPDGGVMSPYVLNGIIDVLRSPETGVLEIWDYKAMERPEDGDPKLRNLEDQMFNYYEIVKSLYPEHEISSAVLYFVNELGSKGTGSPEYRIDLTEATVAQRIVDARLSANGIVELIRAAKARGEFPLPPKGSVDDKTCDACFLRWSCPSTSKTYKLQAP